MSWTRLRQFHIGARFAVYRGERDGESLVVKMARADRTDAESNERLRHEHALLSRLVAPGIGRPRGLETIDGRLALVLNDVGAVDLEEKLRGARLDVGAFLRMAVQMAAAVAGVHRQNLIHRDVSPANFVLNDNGGVTLVDFELATVVTGLAELPRLAAGGFEAALPYVAPEQTGRTNRWVDQRADLYALGATFYQMLTGQPPFSSSDPLEVMHGHLARMPAAPAMLRPDLPTLLSDLVMKLLAKMPEWRYQTADALEADLEEAQRRWLRDHKVGSFELARLDRHELQLAHGLYGREQAQAELASAYARVRRGESVVALIQGGAGVGKTALVESFRASVGSEVSFAAGKCQPLGKHVPFAAFAQALDELTQQRFEFSDQPVLPLRDRVREAVGPLGRVLTAIVPRLESVLGSQPPLAAVGPVETENRAQHVLSSFVRAMARPECPLVLFLDDLQWADAATLKLVRTLSTGSVPNLLILLSWRSEEMDENHPAARLVDEIQSQGAALVSIALTALGVDAFVHMLSDVLRSSPERCRPLAELVHHKTGGNPLFATRFLRMLHGADCLGYDVGANTWVWDLARIAALPAPDSVVDLLVSSIRRLPGPTKQALTVAACIGSRFETDLLARASEHGEQETAEALWLAARENFITLTSGSAAGRPVYRFVHDRVQQAAYELLSEERRLSLHRTIGCALLERIPLRLFDAVEQLNRAATLFERPDEKQWLAELNARAADEAKSSAAYQDALVYLRRALGLLAPDPFAVRTDLAGKLHHDAAQLAFINGSQQEAEQLLATALAHATTRLEQAHLHEMRLFGYTLLLDFQAAIRSGNEALRLFGLDLLTTEPGSVIEQLLGEVEGLLQGKTQEALLSAEPTSDPEQIALQTVLMELMPAVFRTDPRRWVLITLWLMRSVVRHGHTPFAAAAFANFAVLLARREELDRARMFSRVATELAGRMGARAVAPQFITSALSHWWSPLRAVVPVLRRIASEGIESGELTWAWYSEVAVVRTLLLAGSELRETSATLEALLNQPGRRGPLDQLFMYRQMIRCLRGETAHCGQFADDTTPEISLPDPYALAEHATMRLQIAYSFRQLEEARSWFEQAEQHEAVFAINDYRGVYVTYGALSLVAAAERATGDDRARLVSRCRALEAQLRRWVDHCPDNYRHKHELVLAELERIEGGTPEAHYLAAVEAATNSGAIHEEALGYELYGRFCLARGQRHVAALWFSAALDAWARWGASAKVEQLEEELADLKVQAPQRWVTPLTSREGVSLDVLTLFKAAETLSSEVVLAKLLDKLMHICVEAAGAQRASLLVEHEGTLRLEARLDAQRGIVEISNGERVDVSGLVSETIVLHTLRSGEDVVLANAAEEGRFTDDSFVRAHASRSIVSLPVKHRDRITAVLFLENDLSSDAFTPKRLEMLRLLVVQAAISLENARLYDSLRGSEGLMRDFLEGMPVGVYVLDPRGRITLANRKAVEITGTPHDPTPNIDEATRSHHIRVASTNEPYPTHHLPAARALRGETVMVDDIAVVRPDRTVLIAAWATPIRGVKGEVRYAIVAFQDISAQRAMEADRARLEAQLHQAQRLESIGRLSGGIAHDFNNLLTPILIYSELACQALPEVSPIRAQIAQVHEAAESAASLTRQLLAFGRQQVLEPRDLDLNQELRSFERMFRRLVREDIEVRLELDPNIGKVLADHAQMQRVFMNLGMNAVDSMHDSGVVTFETRLGALPDTSERLDETTTSQPAVVLCVRDTGHGMDTVTLDKLFDPFFTTKPPGKGTGLGLPTVYGIVKQHGGEMSVHSEPGRGTTFEIVLPCSSTDKSSLRPPPPASFKMRAGGETVLIVDDNDAVRNVLREVLEGEGYHVISTSSPVMALDLARKIGEGLDILITDLVMPVMGGRELYAKLAPELPHAAVLFISGYAGESAPEVEDDTQAHVARLQKPISREALSAKVAELLRARRSLRDSS